MPKVDTSPDNPRVRPSLWTHTKLATAISTIVTAFAGGGTVVTNYAVELVRANAQERELKSKDAAQERELRAKAAAAEQALETRYVDVALQPCLDLATRARALGYLSTVLSDQNQKIWAQREAESSEKDRKELSDLYGELDRAIDNSRIGYERFVRELPQGASKTFAEKAFGDLHENNLEKVDSIRVRIGVLEGKTCPPATGKDKSSPTASRQDTSQPMVAALPKGTD